MVLRYCWVRIAGGQPDRSRPEGDHFHVGRNGVQQHCHQGGELVLQSQQEPHHHHADRPQVCAGLLPQHAAAGACVR